MVTLSSRLRTRYHSQRATADWLAKLGEALREELSHLAGYAWSGEAGTVHSVWLDSDYADVERTLSEAFLVAVPVRSHDGSSTGHYLAEAYFRSDWEQFENHPLVRMFRLSYGFIAPGDLGAETTLELFERMLQSAPPGNSPQFGWRNKFGHTYALEAIMRERVDLVRLLAKYLGEPQEMATRFLVDAVHRARPEVVRCLLEAGADVNHAERQGSIATTDGQPWRLLDALSLRAPRIVELLLEHGANVHVKDEYGNGPLHYAALLCPESFMPLLAAGAAPTTANAGGFLPADYASSALVTTLIDSEPHLIWPPAQHIERMKLRFQIQPQPYSSEQKPEVDCLEDLVQALGRLDDDGIIHWFEQWTQDREQTILWAAFDRMKRPSERLGLWVLHQGIRHPNPSFNRYWIEPAVRQLGLNRVLRAYIEGLEAGEKNLCYGIPKALYWTREDRSVTYSEAERALREELLQKLWDGMVDGFLATDDIDLLRAYFSRLSQAGAEWLSTGYADRARMEACIAKALAHGDDYLRNRAELMQSPESQPHSVMALPPRSTVGDA